MSLETLAIIYFCRSCGKVLCVYPDKPANCCGVAIYPRGWNNSTSEHGNDDHPQPERKS